jgi:multicomponent Na+:H+ antiporter subunit A
MPHKNIHGVSNARPPPTWVRFAWLLPLGLLATLLALPAGPVSLVLPWVPSLGLELAVQIDALSRLFLLLITGIGTAVFIYAPAYLAGDARLPRLMWLLLLFMLAMVGAVSADGLVLFFLFWEATSVLSFLLVGFDHQQPASRDSARQALLITGGGGLLLLGGILLIESAAPGLRLSDLPRLDPALPADPRFTAGVALVLIAALTKSAQFPFHYWLPGAMAAPTPVSAYLHSATLVKLGVYLLARFDEAMGDAAWWTTTLVLLGELTSIWAAVQALRERDLKRILAWSTVSALGTMTLLIGLPNELGALGFTAFVLAHGLYKAPLFFAAGNIDHTVGTRIIDRLRGLRRTLPLTASAAVLAGVSMAGVPSSFGFVAKDVAKSAKALSDGLLLAGGISFLVSAIGVAVAGVAAIRVFAGKRSAATDTPGHRESAGLALPPLALAAVGILLGLVPGLVAPLLLAAARIIAPGIEDADLAVADPSRLATLALILAIGAAIYSAWDRLHGLLERLRMLDRIGPASAYPLALRTIKAVSGVITRTVQSGRLDQYLAVLVTVTTVIMAVMLWRWMPERADGEPLAAGVLLSCLVMIAGAALAVAGRDLLQRLLGIGTIGAGSAMLFLFQGAPDLALTQLAVETVFVVVAAVSLQRYRPALQPAQPSAAAAAIAVAFGLLLATLSWAISRRPLDSSLSQYFLENSVPIAHGRNVVNVIIVDFRALDTLGEIAVVLLAAIATRPLINRHTAVHAAQPAGSVMLARVTALLYWLMLAAAGWFWLRGHNAPGGGFVGALAALAGTLAVALVFGAGEARRRLPLRLAALGTLGITLALASGLPAIAARLPYLTHLWTRLPAPGEPLSVSTVMLFDLGVLLCVWGALSGFCLRLLQRQ